MSITNNFSDILQTLGSSIKRFQFRGKAQLAFLEDFSLLIQDGIPANRAIEMMAELSTGITRDVALEIAQKISQGQPLAEGMRDWFAVNIVEIIRVGEESGALTDTIKSAVSSLRQRTSTFGALFSAILYPLFIIIMACALIVYLNYSIFPQFREIKPVSQWPSAGQNLVLLSSIIQYWWWILILLIAAIIFVFRTLMNNYVGDLRSTLDTIPPFSLYKRFVASRFLETLGLLITNGVVFKSALKIMSYHATPYLSSHIIMMEHLLGMGRGNVADVLSTGLVSENDILRLRIMAEVKGFEHGLIRMGMYGAEQNVKTMKLIGRIMGGALLILGAMLILMIVQGIYLTGMSMSSGAA